MPLFNCGGAVRDQRLLVHREPESCLPLARASHVFTARKIRNLYLGGGANSAVTPTKWTVSRHVILPARDFRPTCSVHYAKQDGHDAGKPSRDETSKP